MISIGFIFTILLILLIFTINISHILYIIFAKTCRQNHFVRAILLNISFSSLIIAMWIIPFFYFRTIWPSEGLIWRLWSFLFHIIDAVQLYSLLLLITNTNPINQTLQRLFLCLSWLAPIITYSPLLWLSSKQTDYWPFRRLAIDASWWILPILYSSMYLVPIFLSLTFTGLILCWPWLSAQYRKRRNASRRQLNEHRQNMAELTNLIETVLNFELDQSTTSTLNTWVPSVSSLTADEGSLSFISNKLQRSLSYKASQDQSSLLSNDLSSLEKQHSQVNYRQLFLLTCLLLLVHVPYVSVSLMNISLAQLPIFIYIHWFGTMFIPIVHF